MMEHSNLKYSGTTRDGGNSHIRGPSVTYNVIQYDATPDTRSARSPSYRAQQMYTFSPKDRLAESGLSSQELNSVRRTLVEKSDPKQLVESQVRSPRRYDSNPEM